MSGFYDLYVLAPARTTAFADAFLRRFVPTREATQEEYEFPFSGETTATFVSTAALIDHLVANPGESYPIHWRNRDNSVLRFASLWFTNDGGLIAGLSCEHNPYPDTEVEEALFKELRDFCGGAPGYIDYEAPAPNSVAEFLARVNSLES